MGALFSFALPLAAGLLFGAGLIVSGMTDPQRVLGFLDVAGDWNPALALVMGGAITVSMPAFAWARRRGMALTGVKLQLPDRSTITPQLIGGSALFGVGWGLSGVCPGPGVILAAGGSGQALMFFAAMLAGMWLSDRLPQAGGKADDQARPDSRDTAASCG